MLSETPTIHTDNQLSPDIKIRVDSSQIQQVLLNLLKNSLDAMRGIPTENQHIDITLTRVGAHLVLRVRDYGTGLTAVEQERLFEPFSTDTAPGLGLGL